MVRRVDRTHRLESSSLACYYYEGNDAIRRSLMVLEALQVAVAQSNSFLFVFTSGLRDECAHEH